MELTGIDIRHSKHWCGSKLATKLNNKFGVVSVLLNLSKMFSNYNKHSALMKCICLNMSYCIWKLNENTIVSYLFLKGYFNYKFFTWSSRYWLSQTVFVNTCRWFKSQRIQWANISYIFYWSSFNHSKRLHLKKVTLHTTYELYKWIFNLFCISWRRKWFNFLSVLFIK